MSGEKTVFPDMTYTGGVPVNGRIISISFLFNKMTLSIDTRNNLTPEIFGSYPDNLNRIIEKFDSTLKNHLDEIIDGKEIIIKQLTELSYLPSNELMKEEVPLAQADIYFCTRLGFIVNDEFNGMIASIEFDSDQDVKDYILNKKDGEEIWKNAVHSRRVKDN